MMFDIFGLYKNYEREMYNRILSHQESTMCYYTTYIHNLQMNDYLVIVCNTHNFKMKFL